MNSKKQRILCYSPHNFWRLHGTWEMTILQGLRLRGADVRLVMCDSQFKECDVFWDSSAMRNRLSCSICQASTSQLAFTLGMEYQWLGRYTTIEQTKLAEKWAAGLTPDEFFTATYGEWPVGDWVRSSVHSSLRVSEIDFSTPRVEEVYRNYLYSGLIACFGLTCLLDDYQPDKLLLFNGRQSSTRVALELARARNIRVICHERGILNESLQLFENEYALALEPFYKLWNDWAEVPLSSKELTSIREHLLEREYGKNLSWHAFSPPPQDLELLCDELKLDRSKPIWVLFTTSDDEIVAHQEYSGPFDTQMDWIQQTITYVGNNPNIQLVIRVHPNTKGPVATGNNETQALELEELGRTLPPNARMVAPDAPISSYTLMELATAGFVYSSTVGLELACKGKHVVVSGGSYITGLPFIETATSPAHFEQQLEATSQIPLLERRLRTQRLAYRFAYAFFFRWNIPFPLVKMPKSSTGKIAYSTPKDLEEGKDASLDRVCRILLENEPIVVPPRLRELARSPITETTWFVEEFNYLEEEINEPNSRKENNAA